MPINWRQGIHQRQPANILYLHNSTLYWRITIGKIYKVQRKNKKKIGIPRWLHQRFPIHFWRSSHLEWFSSILCFLNYCITHCPVEATVYLVRIFFSASNSMQTYYLRCTILTKFFVAFLSSWSRIKFWPL